MFRPGSDMPFLLVVQSLAHQSHLLISGPKPIGQLTALLDLQSGNTLGADLHLVSQLFLMTINLFWRLYLGN